MTPNTMFALLLLAATATGQTRPSYSTRDLTKDQVLGSALGTAPYERLKAVAPGQAMNQTVTYGVATGYENNTYNGGTGGYFCKGNNIAVMESKLSAISAHSCTNKCAKGCTGPDCFCAGYIEEFDAVKSDALCLSSSLCAENCSLLDHCYGYETQG